MSTTMKAVWAAAVVVGLAAGFGAAMQAANAQANLNVSANVSNNCTISTAPVAFGAYDPVGANAAAALDASGTVTIACTKGATATIGLDTGLNASGGARRMSDGAATPSYLTYEIYQNAGRTTLWGNAAPDLVSPVAAPSKAARSFTAFGRVPANQDVPAGAYADTVTATVNF
jgi:spore coat protein U-like protein